MDNELKQHIQNLNTLISSTFEEQIELPNVRKIVFSALEVFSRKSVEATKINDIAKQAGFSQGYIYNYFSSKEDLFSKIIELAAEGGAKSINHADSLPLTPFNKLCALGYAMSDLDTISVQHFKLILMLISSPDSVPVKAKEVYSSSARTTLEALIKIIVEGQKTGDIQQGNPITFAISFFSVVHGLLLMKLQAKDLSQFPTIESLLNFMK